MPILLNFDHLQVLEKAHILTETRYHKATQLKINQCKALNLPSLVYTMHQICIIYDHKLHETVVV